MDAAREPVLDAYIESHPNVTVTKVIFDGDGNGATGFQTKIQLWNRAGTGWPDVIFSEQANDPVWMGQKPFDFAADLNRSSEEPDRWLAEAVARAVHGQRPSRLSPGQPGSGSPVLQPEAHGPVRLHGSEDVAAVGRPWPEGRQAASRLHHRHRRRVVQSLDVPLGQPVPDRADRGSNRVKIDPSDMHCTGWRGCSIR